MTVSAQKIRTDLRPLAFSRLMEYNLVRPGRMLVRSVPSQAA